MSQAFTSRTLEGFEGDDVIGILATSEQVQGEKIIVANDKDLCSVPGKIYRPKDGRWLEQDRPVADFCHMMQTLTGDTTDGYPGCPRIGLVKATAILTPLPRSGWTREAWSRIVLAFKGAGKTEADALAQARVARICRAEDFDFSTRRVVPWNPPR